MASTREVTGMNDVDFDFAANAQRQRAEHAAIRELIAGAAPAAPAVAPLAVALPCTCGGNYTTCRCPARYVGTDADGFAVMVVPQGL